MRHEVISEAELLSEQPSYYVHCIANTCQAVTMFLPCLVGKIHVVTSCFACLIGDIVYMSVIADDR